MSKIKEIAVFTSIRSEYGLLRPLLYKLSSDQDFRLLLVAGGAHLSHQYGYTISEIIEDGFNIDCSIDFLVSEEQKDFVTKSMGKLQIEFGSWLSQRRPDLLVVLGDRFELIPVVSSALVLSIPVAHISGGDITEGAIDNQIRHAITKMAHLHFPATEKYKNNLLQMGEEGWRICVSGEPGLDQIINMNFYEKEELFEALGLQIDRPVICCTFHPETIDNEITSEFIRYLFLHIIHSTPYQILATASNFDEGGVDINQTLEELSSQSLRIIYQKSLGQRKHYSLLKYALLMLGNSSSGIVEAQSFNLPAINVGKRQSGRLINKNVFTIKAEVEEILKAFNMVLSDAFRQQYFDQPNIYGDGKASDRIISFIKNIPPDKNLLMKKSIFNG